MHFVDVVRKVKLQHESFAVRLPRNRDAVPLRHLRHMPPPPDGMATLVNSLQNRVKSITLCVILNAKMGNSPCESMHSD